MKKIKTIFSIILVLSMILPQAIWAEDSTKNAEYQKSMQILMALNLLTNHTDADYGNTVSRMEFAQIVARIVFPDNNYYWSSDKKYNDVKSEYKNIVSALADQKIMLGYDENTFAPDQQISYNEVIKALVSLTGYDFQAITAGGYPNGYLSCASNIGLLKSFDANDQEKLTLGAVSKLIMNALTIDSVSLTINGANPTYEVSKGTNLLGTKLNIYRSEGLLKATEDTNIYGGSFAAPGTILIGNNNYRISDSSIKKYLGHNVEFYYRSSDSAVTDQEVLIVFDLKKVETLSITSIQIQDYKNNQYTYIMENESKLRKADVSQTALILYNNRVPKTISGDELYLPKTGQVNLIDNDGDGNYDVVFIWDYETYVMESKSVESHVINDYYGKDPLDLDPENVDFRIIKNGEEIGIDKIEKWNVLSVATSDDDAPFVTVIVSDKRVTGKVNSYENNDYVYIDGVDYPLSPYFNQKRNTNQSFDFYFDFLGYAVVYDKNSGDDYKYYGIITGYKLTDEFLETPPEIKIFTEDGSMKWYATPEKITLDGAKIKSVDVFDRSNVSVIIDADGIIPQMIGYKINQKGEVDLIDTVETGANEDTSDEYLNQSRFFPTRLGNSYMLLGHTWNDEIALANSTTIFRAPSYKNAAGDMLIYRGLEYEKYYAVQQWGVWYAPFYDHYDIYPVRFYNVNETQVSDLMIYYSPIDGSDSSEGEMMVVKSFSETLNSEDEIVKQLVCWDKNAEVKKINIEIGKESAAEGIVAGDVVRYTSNNDGEITTIKRYTNAGSGNYLISSTSYTQIRVLSGVITSIDRDQNVILVSYQKDSNGKWVTPGIVNVLGGENGYRGNVMKYSVRMNTIEKGTWADLGVGQSVIIDKSETAVRSVIIVGQ